MEFTIRPAKPADIKGLLSLYDEWDPPKNPNPEWRRALIAEAIASPTGNILVAESSRRALVGMVHVTFQPRPGKDGYQAVVEDLFIRSFARGLGVGTQLMQGVIDLCKARGHIVRLQLISWRGLESYHRGYFQGLGFEERDLAVFRWPRDLSEPAPTAARLKTQPA